MAGAKNLRNMNPLTAVYCTMLCCSGGQTDRHTSHTSHSTLSTPHTSHTSHHSHVPHLTPLTHPTPHTTHMSHTTPPHTSALTWEPAHGGLGEEGEDAAHEPGAGPGGGDNGTQDLLHKEEQVSLRVCI